MFLLSIWLMLLEAPLLGIITGTMPWQFTKVKTGVCTVLVVLNTNLNISKALLASINFIYSFIHFDFFFLSEVQPISS